jgi:hypothetical protein
MPHCRRDGAVVPRRDEGQPPQNGGDGDNVDDRPRLGLIQLLRSALARVPPPGGGVPAADQTLKFMTSLAFVCIKNGKFIHCSCVVCTLFAQDYWGAHVTRFHLQPGAALRFPAS